PVPCHAGRPDVMRARQLHAPALGTAGQTALVATALLLFVYESWHPHAQLDDAFISYRYARNIVSGAGLVFNPGEYVEGFSNLLWTLLVAAGLAIGGDADVVGHVLGLASGVIVLLATWVLARAYTRGSGPAAGWTAVLAPWIVLASVPFTAWATSGMETPLFAAAVAVAFLGERCGRPWTATAGAILATLTRPEGPLVAACVFGPRLLA